MYVCTFVYEAEVLRLPGDVWRWLVLPRLRPSEVRAVGRCGGSAWLAFLAAQQLRSIMVFSALFFLYCFHC